MADMDAFERSMARALVRLADDVAGTVDAVAVAHRVALEHPRRRTRALAWGPVAVPRLAWVLLLAGMLLALAVGSLVAGGWRPDLAVVIAPSPHPTMSVVDEATDILATTKAKPLPTQAICPTGSNPDVLGLADQWRPSGGDGVGLSGAIAFDRHAGQIVLLAGDEHDPYGRWRPWTYDVCTNTWHRMGLSESSSPTGSARLVYDADSDRTLAFVSDRSFAPDFTEIWSYNLAADRWTKVGSFPQMDDRGTYGTVFYHDPSGLVVTYDGVTMWAYDVDTNTLSKVRQRPDPSLPAGTGLPDGKIAFGYDPGHDLVVAVEFPWELNRASGSSLPPPKWLVPSGEWGETWTFDPRYGSWRREAAAAAADLLVCGVAWRGSTDCYPTNGRAVFDEASGLPVFINRDSGGVTPGRIDAYDAGQGAWRTLYAPTGAGASGATPTCSSMPPVYDPLNGRIVCLVSGDPSGSAVVSAFSTATGQWRWLLEPSPTQPPGPTPAPGATPVDWGTPPPGWQPPEPAPAATVAP